jgi:poly(A) polymerase
MRESTLKRFLRKPRFLDHLEMHRVDCLSSHGNLDAFKFCKAKLRDLGKAALGPPRLITGHDLIDLGYSPGPLFRQILESVEDRQLENGLEDRDEALEFVRATFPLEAKTQS